MLSHLRDALLPLAAGTLKRPEGPTDDTILILQPDHLGDILLSQPAVRFLRGQFPDSHLVGVVGPWSQEIASMSWPVDEILTLEYPGFTRQPARSAVDPYRQLFTEADRLRHLRPRRAYVLRPDAWWAAWLAALVAPEVVTSGDARTGPFATVTAVIRPDAHASQRSFAIASTGATVGVPTSVSHPLELLPDTVAARDARGLLAGTGVAGDYVVVHPGSGAPVKEWPVDRWVAACGELMANGRQVVITGGASEADLCNAIAGSVDGCISIAGRTTVSSLAEVLRQAAVVVGPDCGPLHLAVATGTPTVHLFGPSDPVRYGPWGHPERHRVVRAGWSCPRCGDLSAVRPPGCGCMLAIQSEQVLDAISALVDVDAS